MGEEQSFKQKAKIEQQQNNSETQLMNLNVLYSVNICAELALIVWLAPCFFILFLRFTASEHQNILYILISNVFYIEQRISGTFFV